MDLKAFYEAVKMTNADIKRLRSPFEPEHAHIADILQWMLVQIDDLTNKVAELEKK